MKRAELFSGLFYVAASRLNSPRLQSIETPALTPVKEAVAHSKADGRQRQRYLLASAAALC
jgi:hypothetical protein